MDPQVLRTAYDREADRYDGRFLGQQRPKFEALAALVSAPAPGSRVLDLGGGTGLLREHLVARDPAWAGARFVVADLSPGMLRVAKARGQAAVAADARRLPFRKSAFSLGFCVTGLVDPDDVARALPSIARVLAPGGAFGLSLRARVVPDDLAGLLAALPLACEAESEAAGDRIFVLRRR